MQRFSVTILSLFSFLMAFSLPGTNASLAEQVSCNGTLYVSAGDFFKKQKEDRGYVYHDLSDQPHSYCKYNCDGTIQPQKGGNLMFCAKKRDECQPVVTLNAYENIAQSWDGNYYTPDNKCYVAVKCRESVLQKTGNGVVCAPVSDEENKDCYVQTAAEVPLGETISVDESGKYQWKGECYIKAICNMGDGKFEDGYNSKKCVERDDGNERSRKGSSVHKSSSRLGNPQAPVRSRTSRSQKKIRRKLRK